MPRRQRRSEEEDEVEEERSAKRFGVSKFFDYEAQEADSGEDEENFAEDEDDDFIDKEEHIQGDYDVSERVHPRPMLPTRDDEDDVEAMEKMVKARYARSSTNYDEDFYEEATEVEQQALLPSVRDAKLWMVKCLPGHERKVAASLLQKTLDKCSELRIISVIALDHLQNYIYVEAYNEAHVREACKGMRSIFPRNITMVPLKEMSNVLSVESPEVIVSRGDWVRLKRSDYKGSLAKVVDIDDVRRKVTVKVAPRSSSASFSDRMGVYKTVAIGSVATGNIQPSIEELENFRETGEGDDDLATLFEGKDQTCWMRGDLVVVAKGELKNMKGSVEYVEGDIVHIKPKEKIPLKTVAVRRSDLAKFFEPGCHVKVITGAREGTTGLVIKVDQKKLVILSDDSKEEITVFAAQVVEWKETSDAHFTRDDGHGDRNRNRVSASRNLSRPTSSTQFLHRRDLPATFNQGHSGKRHDSMIGTKVKITCGPYRGYRGCIKGVNGQNVRVELEAQMKVITVDRGHITDKMAVPSTTGNMTPGRETPMHPQTPMHSMGGQTPWRTPAQTPLRTPLRTPPHQSTPIHHSSGTSGWDQSNPSSSLPSPNHLAPHRSTPIHHSSGTSGWDLWNPSGSLPSPTHSASHRSTPVHHNSGTSGWDQWNPSGSLPSPTHCASQRSTPVHHKSGTSEWGQWNPSPTHCASHRSTPVCPSSGIPGWDQWNPVSVASPSQLVPTP